MAAWASVCMRASDSQRWLRWRGLRVGQSGNARWRRRIHARLRLGIGRQGEIAIGLACMVFDGRGIINGGMSLYDRFLCSMRPGCSRMVSKMATFATKARANGKLSAAGGTGLHTFFPFRSSRRHQVMMRWYFVGSVFYSITWLNTSSHLLHEFPVA